MGTILHGEQEHMGQVAALFDMDKTLLDASSGQLYARYLYRTGQISRWELARVAWWVILSRLGLLDLQNLVPRLVISAAGDDEPELRRQCDLWFGQDVLPHLTEAGRRRLAEHQVRGHIVAIISGSTQYSVRPLAEHLGIPDQYMCTRLEAKDGRLTGKVVPPVCLGTGKIVWAERFAADHGVDLSASYFYTDSYSDLPLLERVGHPIAVNPDPRLRRLAKKRGWPLVKFY